MALSVETKCVHLEKSQEETAAGGTKPACNHYGSLSFPIYQTATYAHPAVGQSTGFDYSRLQNPTREQLEKVVCQLEHGVDAFALSSGMAAITLLMELFKPGEHLIVDSDLYGGTIRLFDNVSAKNGIRFTRANCSTEDIEKLIQPETKAIYIETPTNPMMNVTDIALVAKIAKQHKILLIVDNTFMSPYFQNPLELGADIVVHSGTKFLAGHNDTLAGFIVVKSSELQEKLRFLIKTTGAGLSAFDSWLVLRGIKTLALRMQKAQDSALKIANWLKTQNAVTSVIYPGLKEHQGYNIMKKQSRGFGAMVTFRTNTTQKALSVLEKVNLIKYAESLGGVETLITYPTTQTHADVPEELRLKNGITPATLRLSVGIENAGDLIADLEQALK
ncbi:MAG: PLP-dependent transferase [Treponema sp.]|nr:PLP-dependent transferase [Treponema sp.]